MYLVTTLLDPVAYPAADLAELYRARWNAEGPFHELTVALNCERNTFFHRRLLDEARKTR